MPYVQANNLEVYYEVQGEGEPLVLIPYLAADQACYAFQVADYAKRFTCYTVDLRGAGLSGRRRPGLWRPGRDAPPAAFPRNLYPALPGEAGHRRHRAGAGASARRPRQPRL